jgi:hypothetical protein
MLKKLAVIGLTAGALVLVAPVAATAASFETPTGVRSTYAEEPGVTLKHPIIDVCEASTIAFTAGYFVPGERVAVSVSGANAAAASVSGDVAGSDGSLVVSFRPPADGGGTYSVTFSSTARTGGVASPGTARSEVPITPGSGYTATITVTEDTGANSPCHQDPGPAQAGTELPLTGDGMELALTGGGASP